MADWYVSSVNYTAISAWAATTAYTVGQFLKPLTATDQRAWTFRCTTAGTSAGSEPNWATSAPANGNSFTNGTAVFQNVTGQSTYGWGGASGDVTTLLNVNWSRFAAGDRIFVAQDHSEAPASAGTYYYGSGSGASASYTSGQILCVNRAGSVPPVAADLTTGASISTANVLVLEAAFPVYHYGITYAHSGSSPTGLTINSTGYKKHYFDACQLYLSGAIGARIVAGFAGASIVLNNSTLRFGNTGNTLSGGNLYTLEMLWMNTPSAIAGATIPSILFSPPQGIPLTVTARGVDLSAITGMLVQNGTSNQNVGSKYLFDSCRIASGVTRYNNSGVVNTRDLVELVNCYDGTNFISESYQPSGAVTTEFTITLSGGAVDNVGAFSHKMVSNTNVDKYVAPLTGFWMDVNNSTVGGARTATVEIISSASLNNDEISLLLEYEGISGSSLASFVTSLPATMLTTASAVTTSTATWNSSPATPVKQKLQVTFTPQTVGRVRGQVRLGKASTTVYVDPRLVLT